VSSYDYRIVDVFTEVAFEGNALAVVLGADGLDATTMQRVAREFNLSETVFILSPARDDCAVRFRIFTPASELAFAGHPTIGGAFVVRDAGLVAADLDRFSVEEAIGAVPVRVDREARRIWLTTPPIAFGPTVEYRTCAEALGLDESVLGEPPPQIVSAGSPFLFVALRDRASVDGIALGLSASRRMHRADVRSVGVFVFAPTSEGAYSRMFAPEQGIVEDPATGSATGPLAAYMMRYGLCGRADGTRFVSEQGTAMGRRSRLHVHVRGESGSAGIDVGGSVVAVARGEIAIAQA